ncbi:nucleotidyl transferase AbiEii/AbiGii toxin family protein [Winogradskyella sp.]|uniref:nucleotidyl transferase AbiEii/AbiGii toxin family protein n=1 Tax=Winogradskyella sp. TaxID=1883156 RepID=UPI00261DDF47|nr:nucleotidyl transferase AbiEii/AbiGii toxin family protein [Winogradskyella sp.]
MIKNTPKDFNLLVEQAVSEKNYAHMRPVVEKELLHYDLLFILDKANLLDKLTFRGGTSLRLCYGAARFSEDLDFVGGTSFTTSDLMGMKDCIENYIGDRYGLPITVKTPSESDDKKVKQWQLNLTTAPARRDLPMQKVKIQICSVPAYTREPKALKINYDFLPDGYADTLIMTENIDEIMADKLIAFVATTRYTRHRDIWDLRWLKQQGAMINAKLILAKIKDYGITNYVDKLEKAHYQVDEIIRGKSFYDEISRFAPENVLERTLQKEKFKDFLIAETKELFSEVRKLFYDKQESDEFYI